MEVGCKVTCRSEQPLGGEKQLKKHVLYEIYQLDMSNGKNQLITNKLDFVVYLN